jgi:hypothetical protein
MPCGKTLARMLSESSKKTEAAKTLNTPPIAVKIFSKKKALIYNVLASLTTVLGGVLAYYSLAGLHDSLPYFLAIASSSFIYIAVADLIPYQEPLIAP